MSGVLGQTKPRNGNRDLTGTAAHRLNIARERLMKAGRPAATLTLADLEQEARRWDRQLADDRHVLAANKAERAEDHRAFMKAYRTAEPGDEIGPDKDGKWWTVDDDYDLVEIPAP
jgi:hypothetical protein